MKQDTSRAVTVVLAGAAVLLTAACGFRLAGAVALPESMARTHIESPDRRGELARRLTETFRDAGVAVLQAPEESAALLRIVEDRTGQRVLSVSPRGGPEEIELYHTVRYEILNGDTILVEPRTVTLTRNYRFDKDDILGTEEEGENLKSALASEMAMLILRSVTVVSHNPDNGR